MKSIEYSFLRKRQMLKLSDKYIYLSLISKMKVKYATQVLSHSSKLYGYNINQNKTFIFVK